MKIITVDPSLRYSGIVVFDTTPEIKPILTKLIVTHSRFRKTTGKNKIYAGEDYFRRTSFLAGHFLKLIVEYHPAIFAFELPTGASKSSSAANSMHSVIGVLGAVNSVFKHRTQFISVHPDKVKLALAGDKNADKETMMLAAANLWPAIAEGYRSKTAQSGFKNVFEHIADACGVFEYIRKEKFL